MVQRWWAEGVDCPACVQVHSGVLKSQCPSCEKCYIPPSRRGAAATRRATQEDVCPHCKINVIEWRRQHGRK